MHNQSGFSKSSVIALVTGALVLGSIVLFVVTQNKNETLDTNIENTKAEPNKEQVQNPNPDNNPPTQQTPNPVPSSGNPNPPTTQKSGEYKDYSASVVQAEQTAGNKVVLFFHASWCPFCITANKAFLDNTSQIPSGVTVLKVDYDSNTDLRKKYGVTYQHTFVQISTDGKQVSKWNGGDIENLKKYLK